MGRLDSLSAQMRGETIGGGGGGEVATLPAWIQFLNFMTTNSIGGRASGAGVLGLIIALAIIWFEPNWLAKYVLLLLSRLIVYGVQAFFRLVSYFMALIGKLTFNTPPDNIIKPVLGFLFFDLLVFWTDLIGKPGQIIAFGIFLLGVPAGIVFAGVYKRYMS